jgi:hypothetical protein
LDLAIGNLLDVATAGRRGRSGSSRWGGWLAAAILARLGDGDRDGSLVADVAVLDSDSEALWDVIVFGSASDPCRGRLCALLCHGVCHWNQASRAERLVHSGVYSRVRRRGRSAGNITVVALRAVRDSHAVGDSDQRPDGLAWAVIVGNSCVRNWCTANRSNRQ